MAYLNEELEVLYKKACKNSRLDEAIMFKDFFRGAASKFQNLVLKIQNILSQKLIKSVGRISRIFTKRIRNAEYFIYEQKGPRGRLFGFLYPSAVGTILQGNGVKQQGTTMVKAYFKGQNPKRPEQIVVALDTKANMRISASNKETKQMAQDFSDLPEGNLFNKMSNQLNEIIDMNFIKRQTKAADMERASNISFRRSSDSYDVITPNDIDILDNPDLQEYLATAKVKPNSESIADILSEFITALAYRQDYDDPIPSLLIQGFPGGGKTSIIKAFARNRFKVHILEVASIYKEILGGFPTVQDNMTFTELQNKLNNMLKTPEAMERLKNIMSNPDKTFGIVDLDPENEATDSKVVMRSADIFPEEDGLVHVFFFDEYNRDSEKMAASMNLMLNGSIGNSYHLPLKTIVVAAGNLGINIDRVDVQRLDNATFDRFGAAVLLQKDMISGVEYTMGELDSMRNMKFLPLEKQSSQRYDKEKKQWFNDPQYEKKYNMKLSNSISAIDVFTVEMAKEHGIEFMDNNPEKLELKPLEAEYVKDSDELSGYPTYLLTQRKLDTVSSRVKNRIRRDWILAKEQGDLLADPNEITGSFNIKTKKFQNFRKAEDWEQEWEANKDTYMRRGIISPAALYMHVMQWHVAYLPTVLKQVLGGYPGELIEKIRQTFDTTVREASQISPEDIIYGYATKKLMYGHQMSVNSKKGEKKQIKLSGEEFVDRLNQMSSISDNLFRLVVGDLIENSSTLGNKIKEINGKSFAEIKKDLESAEVQKGGKKVSVKVPDEVNLIAFNLNMFIKDTKPSHDRLRLLIDRMDEYGFKLVRDKEAGKTVVENDEDENKINADKKAREIVGRIYGVLVQKNDIMQEVKLITQNATFDEIDNMGKTNESKIIENGFQSLFKNFK